jgi:cob(I)alamin adenosyltransferase
MQIYTKTGDKGTTSLYSNQRVRKNSLRVEAYGTIDELNSHLGFCKSLISDDLVCNQIEIVQRKLFNIAGELATVDKEFPEKISDVDISFLENHIDKNLDRINSTQKSQFIIPGSNQISGALHIARTVCRRAERRILDLEEHELVSPILIKYVNRLSDFIYSIARLSETELIYVDFKK